MLGLLLLFAGVLARLFCHRLLIENLALRQQLAVFKRQNSRPRLTLPDKLSFGCSCAASGVPGKRR
jgi:hypothetical protein